MGPSGGVFRGSGGVFRGSGGRVEEYLEGVEPSGGIFRGSEA